jgi:hypothetical protein
MSVEKRINWALKQSAKTMNDALDIYWCGYRGRDKLTAPMDNDMSERNVTFHFCNALMQRGFHIYAEVGHNGQHGKNSRIDYVAIDPKENALVAIEAKRLYSADHANKIILDIDRLRHFNIQLPEDYKHGQVKSRLGVILGVSWDHKISQFWRTYENSKSSRSWDKLSNKLRSVGAKNEVQSIGAPTVENYEEGWILMAHFKI